MKIYNFIKRNRKKIEHDVIKLIAVSPDMSNIAHQKYAQAIRAGRVVLQVDRSLPLGTVLNTYQFMKRKQKPQKRPGLINYVKGRRGS